MMIVKLFCMRVNAFIFIQVRIKDFIKYNDQQRKKKRENAQDKKGV